jgi:hypothetical protein
MNILEKYNINPYKFLGITELDTIETIKKAYKKKALIHHPDRNNGDEVQFKILQLCYKYAKKNCIMSEVSDDTQLRDRKKDDVQVKKMAFKKEDFNDTTKRKLINPLDDIDFEEFEKKIKETVSQSKSYSAGSFYEEDLKNKLKKKGGGFDEKKFNAYFLKLKKQNKTFTDLVKVEKVLAFNEDNHSYMMVNSYNGTIVNTAPTPINKYQEKIDRQLSKNDINTLITKTDEMELNKLIKENTKGTEKLSPKALSFLKRKAMAKIAVDRTTDFKEMQKEMDKRQMLQIQKEKEQQMEVVKKYNQAYQNNLIQFID